MPAQLIPVSQHVAIWSVDRGAGSVSLYGRAGHIARRELDDLGDFDAIVTMLADRRGLCFDAIREVLRPSP